MSNKIAAIILAAGKGTRMKSDTHKVLHPIAGRPMLMHIMAAVDALSPAKKVVVVGDKADQIRDALGDTAETAVQEPQLGTGHAVQQAEAALSGFDGDVLVLYGDVPFVPTSVMREMIDRLNAPDQPTVVILAIEMEDPTGYGRLIVENGHVVRVVEEKDATDAERTVKLANSGLVAAKARDLFALLAKVTNNNAQKEYYLTDLAEIGHREGKISVAITTEPFVVTGINSREQLADMEGQWQARRRKQAMADGATLIAPETVWFSADTELGRDVTIEPNVFFGPGVSVADHVTIRANCHIEGTSIASGAEIGPFARLRPGTMLGEKTKIGNFVEVKKTVMAKGAKANHLTYLGDATIGEAANIGAGTITCNYDGYFKYQTIIGDRAFIGSNSALVAPVTIGKDAIVAAGSAVSRDVADGELRLVRAEQAVKQGWATRFHETMKKKKAESKK